MKGGLGGGGSPDYWNPTREKTINRPHGELNIKHNPKGGGLVVKDNRKALKHLRMESRMERRVSVRKSNGHCPFTAMAMVSGNIGGGDQMFWIIF